MTWLRPLASTLTLCFLLGGCTSVPDLPPVTVAHPSHPQARSALVTDRPSILDPVAMDAMASPEATGTEEMDHSQHQMNMDDGNSEPAAAAEATEMDHSQHTMNTGDEPEEPPADDNGEDDDDS